MSSQWDTRSRFTVVKSWFDPMFSDVQQSQFLWLVRIQPRGGFLPIAGKFPASKDSGYSNSNQKIATNNLLACKSVA
jgi:hypothetical protein